MDDAVFERQLRRTLGDRPAADLLAVLEDHPDVAFVGGWVRDVLLGRASDDVDVATVAPGHLVDELRARGGVRKAVLLDEARGTWRVVYEDGRYLDVAALRGDLAADLRLRDLRINAMAWLPGRGVLDPLDGRWDLESRSLRWASDRALADDPLRALRLWRFALELDARPAEPLPPVDLADVASERIRMELERILAHPGCSAAVDALHEVGILQQLLPGELRPALVRGQRRGRPVGPALRRCVAHVASRPDGLLAVRLGWLCRHDDLETALVTRRWSRRTARAAATTSVEVGREPGDLPLELMQWGDRAAWALLGRAALADSPEGAVAPYLSVLDGAAGRPDEVAPVPPLPAPVLPPPEICELLGLRAGPAIGEAVARLVEAQLRGEVSDAGSARAWLFLRRGRHAQ